MGLRIIPPEEARAIVEVYAYARRHQLVRQRQRERLAFLLEHPEDLKEDDLHMMSRMDGRTRRHLLETHPDIRKRFQEYGDSPEKVVSSLHTFMSRAYRHCRLPGEFTDGWHIRALCREWEAFYRGETPRLMVMQPPSSSKSLIANVMFPAWAWAQDPTYSVMQYSYNDDLPKRDGRILSRLVRSDWYRRKFPHVRLVTDSASELETSRGGWRKGYGWEGSATGFHPNAIVIDDPTKAGDVYNKPSNLQKVARWYASTISSRGMIHKSSIAIVMQRLATNDLCGVFLGESSFGVKRDQDVLTIEDDGRYEWRVVCLPMFYDPAHPYLYEHDPRTKKGELLWPEKYTLSDIRSRIREMEMDPEFGGHTTAAQMDQNPLATQGALFEGLRLAMISQEDLPRRWRNGRFIRAWDHASSTDGDYTAGVLLCDYEGVMYVVDVRRFRKPTTDRNETILKLAEWDRNLFGQYRVACEKNAGADGPAAFMALHAKLGQKGILLMGMPSGNQSKKTRMAPVASAIKHGECRIFEGMEFGADFLNELKLFPFGRNDDYVDALAHGYNAHILWRQGKV